MTELERCEIAKQRGYAYNPNTGELKGIYGKLIKSKNTKGYIFCKVFQQKKPYSILAHRLAWYLYYGKLPDNCIDHIDGDKTNNKIENLRDITNQQNQWNKKTAKGYFWNKRNKKFMSCIRLNGKTIHLGYFDNEQDARNAYLEAKTKLHIIQ